jgi:hypothetical protein
MRSLAAIKDSTGCVAELSATIKGLIPVTDSCFKPKVLRKHGWLMQTSRDAPEFQRLVIQDIFDNHSPQTFSCHPRLFRAAFFPVRHPDESAEAEAVSATAGVEP